MAHPRGWKLICTRVILEENTYPGYDDAALRRLVGTTMNGVPFLTLSAEDHAIHALVHGTRWDWVPSLRWVLDLATMLRATETFDWEYFVAEAKQRGVTIAVGAALTVASLFEARFIGVIDELESAKVRRRNAGPSTSSRADTLVTLTVGAPPVTCDGSRSERDPEGERLSSTLNGWEWRAREKCGPKWFAESGADTLISIF